MEEPKPVFEYNGEINAETVFFIAADGNVILQRKDILFF